MSIEQVIRDILAQAIKEGIVAPPDPSIFADPDPQVRTSADLAGCGNLLVAFLRAQVRVGDAAEVNDRWQAAVGMPLEDAERLADTERDAGKRMPGL